MNSVLEGIRVLECAGGINGPSTGCMLGVLGAEVIKIEQPGHGAWERGIDGIAGTGLQVGDGVSVPMQIFNHSKKSLALDLRKERGRELFYKLVAKSDVLITNYHKSAAEKLGIDYETVRSRNERLIYGSTSALGAKGPESERRAFDFTGQARSGMMTAMGEPGEAPAIMVGAPIDQLGAIMLGFGVLAGILARTHTGKGQQVNTSMTGAAIYMQAFHVGISLMRGGVLSRHCREKNRAPLSNYYRCSDNKWIVLTEAQVEKFWPKFCEALELADLADDARFNTPKALRENAAALISLLDSIFATRPRDEWMALLDESVGLACSPVLQVDELGSDPQVLENNYIVDFAHPELGPIKLPMLPILFSETPAQVSCRAPELGEHTEEILLDLCDCTWEDIGTLQSLEVI